MRLIDLLNAGKRGFQHCNPHRQPAVIRKLESTDIDPLSDILEREVHSRMGGYPKEGMDRGYFRGLWESLIRSGKSMALVSDKGGEISGWLLGLEAPDPYSGAPIALEQFWYTRPGAAGSVTAVRLFTEFLEDARHRGCVRVMVGDWNPSGHPDLSRLYARFGFRMIERYFTKEL